MQITSCKSGSSSRARHLYDLSPAEMRVLQARTRFSLCSAAVCSVRKPLRRAVLCCYAVMLHPRLRRAPAVPSRTLCSAVQVALSYFALYSGEAVGRTKGWSFSLI
eukprot:1075061-Pleurochrysis_carterae.AAC.13